MPLFFRFFHSVRPAMMPDRIVCNSPNRRWASEGGAHGEGLNNSQYSRMCDASTPSVLLRHAYPGSESGACFAGSHSPWPPPLAPPAPLPVARLCSSASQLLLRSLTSHVRSSSATAPRLPDAGQSGAPQLARRGISRFPSKELLHMPGSSTTSGRSDLAMVRPKRVAFRARNSVGARGLVFAAQWLACPP